MFIKKTTRHANGNTGSGLVQAQQSGGFKPINENPTPLNRLLFIVGLREGGWVLINLNRLLFIVGLREAVGFSLI
jgi:hypothetical protein